MIPVMMANRRRSAPTVAGRSTNVDGDTLTLTFSEPVAGHAGFALLVNGIGVGLTYTSGDPSNTLVFGIDTPVVWDDVLTLNYTPGDVESVASGLPLAAFTGRSVTNGVPMPPAPTVVSFAAETGPGGTLFTVVFSEAVTGTAGFAVVEGEAENSITITYSSGDGTDTYVFGMPNNIPPGQVYSGQTIRYSYTPGTVESVATNVPLAAIESSAVDMTAVYALAEPFASITTATSHFTADGSALRFVMTEMVLCSTGSTITDPNAVLLKQLITGVWTTIATEVNLIDVYEAGEYELQFDGTYIVAGEQYTLSFTKLGVLNIDPGGNQYLSPITLDFPITNTLV